MSLPAENQTVKATDLYRIAFDARNLEITLFWQRCNYFLVLNSAIALGFFNIKEREYSALLGFVGLVASVLWLCVGLGSKYWQSRWERRLSVIEGELAPGANLFAVDPTTVQKDAEEGLSYFKHGWFPRQLDRLILKKLSVTLMMILLSLVFAVAWLVAIVLCFIYH